MLSPHKYTVRGREAWLFRFPHPDTGKRVRVRFGVVSHETAVEAGAHIAKLLEARKFHQDYPPSTLHWLGTLSDRLYDRLARAKLVGERTQSQAVTLGNYLDDYIAVRSTGSVRKGGWCESTVQKRTQTANDLIAFFGREQPLTEIALDSPHKWLKWMLDPPPAGRGLAPASTGKKLKDARQFFEHACKTDLITRNPFAEIRPPAQDNPDNLHYVEMDLIERVLKVIDDPERRLLVMLARVAGLRIPTEAQALKWSDLNWDKRTMRLRAQKKKGDAAGGQRVCPLFETLVPYFDAINPSRSHADTPVLQRLASHTNLNLRTRLLRDLKQAKIEAWPRIFQNLRASALTDAADDYPLHIVCKWFGNSMPVAMKHYVILRGTEPPTEGFRNSSGERSDPHRKSGP
ncbi:tyrosine-type recombinase/integrase [Aporhodopirellula aestuarii]|uniref:Site-specific integrase n=1 Tax=Aporhodopirellula aestuarii TaxID=2950107 RepID=A0ABT0UAI8_9BACT|nr:site-specific integrase [Aporhodopirellula aestuarii]MCM2373923.1 site-specific integrase [Aporhodopirellula aestuarii]